MSIVNFFRSKQKSADKPYTVYDALGTLDKVLDKKRDYFEARLEQLADDEKEAKEKLKKIQAEIADTKTALKYGGVTE